MENELKRKYDEKNGVVITYDKKGRQFVSFPVSGVPLVQWEEWNKVCEDEFNSNRWQKIFMDHRLNQTVNSLTQQVEEVVPKEQTEEKKKLIPILGIGEVEED